MKAQRTPDGLAVTISEDDLPGLIADLTWSESVAGRWLLRQLDATAAGDRALAQARGEEA